MSQLRPQHILHAPRHTRRLTHILIAVRPRGNTGAANIGVLRGDRNGGADCPPQRRSELMYAVLIRAAERWRGIR
jgi:hypothetical protein